MRRKMMIGYRSWADEQQIKIRRARARDVAIACVFIGAALVMSGLMLVAS